MPMYGYARCSTDNVKQDISRQIRDLKGVGVEEENIFLSMALGPKQTGCS